MFHCISRLTWCGGREPERTELLLTDQSSLALPGTSRVVVSMVFMVLYSFLLSLPSRLNLSWRNLGLSRWKQLLQLAISSRLMIQISSEKHFLLAFLRNSISMPSLVFSSSRCSKYTEVMSWFLRFLTTGSLQQPLGSRQVMLVCMSDSLAVVALSLMILSWQFLILRQYSRGVKVRVLVRTAKVLWFLPIFSRQISLSMTCWTQGTQCRRGQVNLQWLYFLQYSQAYTSNSSGMLRHLSLRKQQSSQSMSLLRKVSMKVQQLRVQSTENLKDWISQLGLILETKSRLVRKGASPSLILISSAMQLLKGLSLRLQMSPMCPLRRMIRLKSSSMDLMISWGWEILVSSFSAKLQRVRSRRVLKKTSLLSISLLASRRQLTLRFSGSSCMSSLSSSRLKCFFILDDSSMQLLMRKVSSCEMLFWLVSFLKVLNLRLRLWSSSRMLEMMVPTLLMLQAMMMQLKVSMKVTMMAQKQFCATMSPNPTVSIMLVAQQNDHTQITSQFYPWMPLYWIQFEDGLMLVIRMRISEIMWAQPKLTRKTLISYQYCSWQMFLTRQTSTFSILLEHWGNLKRMNSLQQVMKCKLLLMSNSSTTKLMKSMVKL